MSDATLAFMGVCLGIGTAIGWAMCAWYRDRVPMGHKQLTRRVFVHCDDLLGATKTENQVRAGKRFDVMRPVWRGGLGRNLGKAWADTWWPVPQFGGTSARPHVKRMAAYVQLTFARPRAWFKPYRIWDIDTVTLHWTSEASALTGAFDENVGRKVAQALRLESLGQLEWDVDFSLGCITYRRKAAPVLVPLTQPVGVDVDA